MQAYQSRTIDKQSEFTDFITDTSNGLAGRIAGNAFIELISDPYYLNLEAFPPYLDLVKILKGTATEEDISEFADYLTNYAGEYSDYTNPTITEEEFIILKTNLPKLIKALGPLIVADARYTQETFGEEYSLYYTYTLISNITDLVIGHIPESIMPILKAAIVPIPKVPDTGAVSTTSKNNQLKCYN
jgi:hypothetical protein